LKKKAIFSIPIEKFFGRVTSSGGNGARKERKEGRPGSTSGSQRRMRNSSNGTRHLNEIFKGVSAMKPKVPAQNLAGGARKEKNRGSNYRSETNSIRLGEVYMARVLVLLRSYPCNKGETSCAGGRQGKKRRARHPEVP